MPESRTEEEKERSGKGKVRFKTFLAVDYINFLPDVTFSYRYVDNVYGMMNWSRVLRQLQQQFIKEQNRWVLKICHIWHLIVLLRRITSKEFTSVFAMDNQQMSL